jgi:hypothetical protein
MGFNPFLCILTPLQEISLTQPRGQGMNPNMPFAYSNRWNNYPSFIQMSYPPYNQMQYTNQMKYPPMQQTYPPMQQNNPPFVDPSMWTPWPP